VRRLVNLLAFAVLSSIVVAGLLWAFRGQLLRFAGVSFDTGEPAETRLVLPDGFAGQVFASGLGGPRFMALAADGTLLVAERGRDRVVALPDRDRDGRADETIVVGNGYDRAHSLAFARDGTLLVAGTTTVHRVEIGPDLRESRRSVFADGLPGPGGHDTRTVLVRSDGLVFVAVGSSCNVCQESDEERAAVLLYSPDGRAREVRMVGLRNAVGLAEEPATGRIIATLMGRDGMGDDVPPETIYEVVEGGDGGWPRCHAGTIVDPDFGHLAGPDGAGCQGVAQPLATFQAHMAPLGLAFWRDHLVIAFHGSWNRSSKVGYKVMWLPWFDGRPIGPAEDLVTGFLEPGSEDSSGRPAGVIVGADGALYISDDKAGFIYRIADESG
jgi:glucose/arabinose dehydrogenase